MDDLRLLQQMRADAPEPDTQRMARLRDVLTDEITFGAGVEQRAATGAPPSAAPGTLASQGAVRGTSARRVPRRLTRVGAVLSGVAAAVLVAVAVQGGTATPAFAVDQRPDGSVEVWISEFRDPADLEAELAEAGVKAEVDYLPAGQTCKEPRGKAAAAGGHMKSSVGGERGGISFSISKGQVTGGRTLVLAVSHDQANPSKPPVGMSLTVVEGTVSACEPVAMPKPTDGPSAKDGSGYVTRDKGDGPSHHTNQDDGSGPSHDSSTE
ncbi:hypothetical protein [Nonomuraea sp. LPB2021202275-12-8]|uniref:hypothetical protein n=1 Tax=Nonomuraea sp. LPB2021202275-12-8 TaxID=3120159 RepID=UPI00300D9813